MKIDYGVQYNIICDGNHIAAGCYVSNVTRLIKISVKIVPFMNQ